MSDFVHLRVASGYSMQYGASHPGALVAQAAEQGMDACAITDRDGMYGAVRFAKACVEAGLKPIVGVDFGLEGTGGRVAALATPVGGWAALCRLTSATHLAGSRGQAFASPASFAQHAGEGTLQIMLGPDSAFGLACTQTGSAAAEAELRRWLALVGPASLVVAVSHQLVAGDGVGSVRQASRMTVLADAARVRVVLTNQVRMAQRVQARTCDVLDAARRLVPLSSRSHERANAEGWLKPGAAMVPLAAEVSALAGRGDDGARLLADTRALAEQCMLDPAGDIGLGQVHLPELDIFDDGSGRSAAQLLRAHCEAGLTRRYGRPDEATLARLDDELAVIATLGFESYFLTVADVVDEIRTMGVRCAARGSGAGSLVNYCLGISGVDPMATNLIMERFLSPLRQALPDIDIDVESARRTEIYERIFDKFGGRRVSCVAMLETYRVRQAVRDVGAALSLPPGEIDAMAKAFPHIRARDARAALRDLPELRTAGFDGERLQVMFELVESLDGLPRHLALHPCGILLSDVTLGDRTPIEASYGGFPMSQFDKDDVEDMGFLKLDVLGIRMQSSMAHALAEIERTTGSAPDIDALAPFDDEATYDLIAHAATLGCFQIESPGQRELVGKFGPSCFNDLIIDISLFRPGPVKSNMIIPFLDGRQGWKQPTYLHPSLIPALEETCGVVVYHEQVIKVISIVTGCSLAEGDEWRRSMGDMAGQEMTRAWLVPRARARGYSIEVIDQIWDVLVAFASFGFCKAHAAAFALPTYQSAWLKTHYPAHFMAGLLTHDPGLYPKRLIVEEARRMGVTILGLDVNASKGDYTVELLESLGITSVAEAPDENSGLPDARDWGLRMSLADVKGISLDEITRIVAGQPYTSLSDFCARARVDFPVIEHLALAGGFDGLYGIDIDHPRRGQVTRRDLLLTIADLRRVARSEARVAARARGLRRINVAPVVSDDPRDLAQAQAVGEVIPTRAKARFAGVQLALDFESHNPVGDGPGDVVASGLPEMAAQERLSAELDILGIDASAHVVDHYKAFLAELGATPSSELLGNRQKAKLLVAGVKVATQTPPIRSGYRVLFLTLDDSTGLNDSTFFPNVQGLYASTVFNSWLLVVRGELRRTGAKGVSLRATGAWSLEALHAMWKAALDEGCSRAEAIARVHELIDASPEEAPEESPEIWDEKIDGPRSSATRAGGMGRRRVLVHASGFVQSPYADLAPPGTPTKQAPRKLWHSSPGSSGA